MGTTKKHDDFKERETARYTLQEAARKIVDLATNELEERTKYNYGLRFSRETSYLKPKKECKNNCILTVVKRLNREEGND